MDGFRIFEKGKPILEDVNKAGTFKLIIQDSDFEIFESNINAGRSIICQPYECEDSLNVAFVMSGRLYHSNSKSFIEAGEHYAFKNLTESHHLSVVENTKLLMIRKKGFFIEQISMTNSISEHLHKIQEKDQYTEEHCNSTGNLAVQIATHLKFSDQVINNVLYAGKIHDVGKIYVPTEILNKPERLTYDEFEIMKKHPQNGYDIVMEFQGDEDLARILLEHHEKLDGSGYPRGLKGDEISLEAKIITVADCFDAMTSDRPYRKAMDVKDAIEELRRHAGVWYEGEIVEALVEVVGQG